MRGISSTLKRNPTLFVRIGHKGVFTHAFYPSWGSLQRLPGCFLCCLNRRLTFQSTKPTVFTEMLTFGWAELMHWSVAWTGGAFICGETHAALIDPGTFLQFLAKGEEGRLGALNGIFVGGERLKNSGFFRGVFSFSFSRWSGPTTKMDYALGKKYFYFMQFKPLKTTQQEYLN